MKSLDCVPIGMKCIVQEITGSAPIRTRMLDMGLTKGTEVTVVREAPLGDPIEFEVRGYNLSLRREEAHMILVRELNDAA
ncbi:MAG TPA: ferrous iron transport protein A [Anaerolineaceae bacterium]|nr:ferrous iron transport protein A [Anaerolineaceae bacterium]